MGGLSEIKKYCDFRSIKLSYIELPSEGENFRCELSFDGIKTIGEGTSKEEAKNNAVTNAKKLLKESDVPHQKLYGECKFPDDELLEQAVPKLLKYCSEKNMAAPIYEFYEKDSLFFMTCKVGDLNRLSIEKSEKMAMDVAAHTALYELKQYELEGAPQPKIELHPDETCDDDMMAAFKKCDLKGAKSEESSTPADYHLAGKRDPFFLENPAMQRLNRMLKNEVLAHPDPHSLLRDVTNGYYQLLIRSQPTNDNSIYCVYVGYEGADSTPGFGMIEFGDTFDEAKQAACLQLLLFFKILMQ